MLYKTVLALHHLFTCIHLLLLSHPHNMHPYLHTLYLSSPPAQLLRHVITEPCILRKPNLSCTISILISITVSIEHRIHHFRAHTYTSPPPGDLTLPYLLPTVHNVSYLLYSPCPTIYPYSTPPPPSEPLWPPSSLAIVSMPTIINGWACMYASLPG